MDFKCINLTFSVMMMMKPVNPSKHWFMILQLFWWNHNQPVSSHSSARWERHSHPSCGSDSTRSLCRGRGQTLKSTYCLLFVSLSRTQYTAFPPRINNPVLLKEPWLAELSLDSNMSCFTVFIGSQSLCFTGIRSSFQWSEKKTSSQSLDKWTSAMIMNTQTDLTNGLILPDLIKTLNNSCTTDDPEILTDVHTGTDSALVIQE